MVAVNRLQKIVHEPLTLILIVALVVRLVFLVAAGLHAPLTGDEIQYQQLAENVAAGRGFTQNNSQFFPGQVLRSWQSPLYPFYLAVFYKLFGSDPLVGKLATVLVSVVTVYVTFLFGRRVFGERVGLLAALLFALYPSLATTSHVLLTETLVTFLLGVSLTALTRFADAVSREKERKNLGDILARCHAVDLEGTLIVNVTACDSKSLSTGSQWIALALAGVSLGLAALTRSVAFEALPFLGLWLAWILRCDWRRLILAGTLFVTATLVVVAPWVVRNYAIYGRFVLVDTKGGIQLLIANHPQTPTDFIRNVWKTGVREPLLAGLPVDEVERDRIAWALAVDYIVHDPLTFIRRAGIKFADYWGFERNLVDIAELTHNGKSGGWNSLQKIGMDALVSVAYVVIMLAALVGFFFAPGNCYKGLVFALVGYFTLAHLIAFGDSRYHLPLVPYIVTYAAYAFLARPRVSIASVRGFAWAATTLMFIAVWLREIAYAVITLRGV